MKVKAADFLIYDKETGTYRENPEQAVRDDVEKHYWLHVGRTIATVPDAGTDAAGILVLALLPDVRAARML